MENIQDIIEKIAAVIDTHKLSDGRYARWITPGKNNRDTGINPYGCADAANILYTIGRFPSDADARAEWVKALREMQNPETGLFNESTHHPIHTTAHCMAALELFDGWDETIVWSALSRSIRRSRCNTLSSPANSRNFSIRSTGITTLGRSRIRAREYMSR